MKENFVLEGRVQKLKLIKAQDPTLVHVTLETEEGKHVRCLIARKALTFLMEVQEGDDVNFFGHYNQRGQFVIQKYLNAHKHHPLDLPLPPHLKYPHRKED